MLMCETEKEKRSYTRYGLDSRPMCLQVDTLFHEGGQLRTTRGQNIPEVAMSTENMGGAGVVASLVVVTLKSVRILQPCEHTATECSTAKAAVASADPCRYLVRSRERYR